MSENQTTEAPVEQRYEYQPVDETGRPIGGKQVIKYTTNEELVTKLQEQNILLIRKLRDQTRKVRLGIEEVEELPEDAVHFNVPVDFTPRELSDEERYDIARRLADPTTATQASQELVESQLGAPLSVLGETLRTIQQDNQNLRAKIEVNAFKADNPEYYKCQENFEAITGYMVRYKLAPVKENFQRAYDILKAQDLLVTGAAEVKPVVEEIPVVEAEPVVEVIPASVPVVQQHRIPTGLTRDNSSDSGPSTSTLGSEITYSLNGRVLTGLAAVAAMPSDEYKKRLQTDRNFSKNVDKLEAEARKPRG